MRSRFDKRRGHSAPVLAFLSALLSLLALACPSRAAYARTGIVYDGIASVDRADCILDCDFRDYEFSTDYPDTFMTGPAEVSQKGSSTIFYKPIYVQYQALSKKGSWSTGDKSFTLTYRDAILDRWGQRHDLCVRISNVHGYWKQSLTSGVVRQLIVSVLQDSLEVHSYSSCLYDTSFNATKYSYAPQSPAEWLGVEFKIEAYTPDGSALRYNLYASDIDQPDKITYDDKTHYEGPWSEGMRFDDSSDLAVAHLEPDTYLMLYDGRLVGSTVDLYTARSAFTSQGTINGSAAEAGSGVSFWWAGSQCSTRIFEDWSYEIVAKAAPGGSVAQIAGSDATAEPIALETRTIEEDPFVTELDLEAVPRNDYVVSITPDPGYRLEEVTLDGAPLGPVSSVPLESITADHVVTATFAPANGMLQLVKTSVAPGITDGNPLYSLADAQYAVFDDQDCTNLVGTLVTADDGSASISVTAGTYWVRETQAPAGYALDAETHEVTVPEAGVGILEVAETPLVDGGDPFKLVVRKRDADAGASSPQGDASLAGAQFTLSYYAGHHSEEDLPEQVTRQWVLSTGEDGVAALDETHLVSGDEFYVDDAGHPVIPLGTVVVTETAAPKGYRIPDEGVREVRQIRGDGGLLVDSLAELVVDEPVVRGGLRLKKVDASGGTGVEGAEFAITNASDANVVVGGTSYGKGKVCLTISTGEDGIASVGPDVLPFGRYTLTESKAPEGYLLDRSWTKTVTITKDGEIVDLTDDPVANERDRVHVNLVGQKTFDGRSQGRTLTAGLFSFTLEDERGTVLQPKRNDADGKVTFDALEFTSADLGSTHVYRIRELAGDDEEIVYDGHAEEVAVHVEADEAGALSARVETDDDGIVFNNRTTPRVTLPRTGMNGVGQASLGTIGALAAASALARRLLRRGR